MRRKLYFGDLWFEATQTELRDWFGELGPIETWPIASDWDDVRHSETPFCEGTEARVN
jgi:hypothetical protein